MLVVLSAPSGAGKTTIAKILLQDVEGLEFSISATTRQKRDGERDKVDYYFLTKEEFEERIAQNDLVEYEQIFGNYYGTLKSAINIALKQGKNLLFDVDVKGGISLKRLFPEDAILIFVKPPSLSELRNRIEKRGTDSKEQIGTRMERAEWELSQIDEFDYVIENDNLQRAVNEVKKIIREKTGLKV